MCVCVCVCVCAVEHLQISPGLTFVYSVFCLPPRAGVCVCVCVCAYVHLSELHLCSVSMCCAFCESV